MIVLIVMADYVPPVRRFLADVRVLRSFRVLGAILVAAVAVDIYPTVLSHLARLSAL